MEENNVVEVNDLIQEKRIVCPSCGSYHVTLSQVQENQGTVQTSHTKSKYKEKGHGILWWLLIGWWWWIVDLCIWLVAFVPRLILRIFAMTFKKKKYKGSSNTVSVSKNIVAYKTLALCQNCGYGWEVGTAAKNDPVSREAKKLWKKL